MGIGRRRGRRDSVNNQQYFDVGLIENGRQGRDSQKEEMLHFITLLSTAMFPAPSAFHLHENEAITGFKKCSEAAAEGRWVREQQSEVCIVSFKI
jgi:hypothetical protein